MTFGLAIVIVISVLLVALAATVYNLLYPATIEISYTVVEDPQVLATAREFIKFVLSTKPYGIEATDIDWLNADIAVLRIVIVLFNRGSSVVYLMTGTGCVIGGGKEFKPFTRIIALPITSMGVPEVIAEEGYVFPLPIMCTAGLVFVKLSPRESVVNEYYYIVTKPFKGIVKANAYICSESSERACRIIEDSTRINVP